MRIKIVDWDKYQSRRSQENDSASWFKMPNFLNEHLVWDELKTGGQAFLINLLMYISRHHHRTGEVDTTWTGLRRKQGIRETRVRQYLDILKTFHIVEYQELSDALGCPDKIRIDKIREEDRDLRSKSGFKLGKSEVFEDREEGLFVKELEGGEEISDALAKFARNLEARKREGLVDARPE